MKSIVIISIFCFLSVAGERYRRQINPNFQGFPAFSFPNIQPGQPGSQTTSTFSTQSISSRFGENKPVVTGQTTHFSSSGNQFQQTNTVLRPDGSTQTNRQSGRFRRETPLKKEEKPSKDTQSPVNIAVKQQNIPKTPVAPQQNFQQQPIKPNNPANNRPNNQLPPTTNNRPNIQQPNYPQQPYLQQPYPQQAFPQQPLPVAQFPFGIGFFGQPQFGFQNPFGFAPVGFGQQPIPAAPIQPGIPAQGAFVGASQTLDNRFGEEEGVINTGSSQIITSQNGNYHITSSILKPNGQVVTSQQSGTINKKP